MNRSNWIGIALTMLVASNGTGLVAADRTVQEFDGWKIVIQPGDFGPPNAINIPVPPSPAVTATNGKQSVEARVRLVSLETDAGPSGKGLAPAPAPRSDDDGLPIITPGDYGPAGCPAGCEATSIQGNPIAMARLYSEVYRSIPFNRAEYNANPSYIHDATMEILFGQLRPTVIHKGSVQVYSQSPLGYCYPATTQLIMPGLGLRIHRTIDN